MAAITKYFTAEEKRLAANRRARKWDAAHLEEKRAISRRWAARNKKKAKAAAARYKKRHPDRVAAHNRAGNWRTKGLDIAACRAALAGFKGACEICGSMTSQVKATWSVDHCHKTMKVRGVLCHYCNILLGAAKDDPRILLAAVEYLKRHE